jgi:hypothetical protein
MAKDLEIEVVRLRKLVIEQQALISRMRDENRRLRTLRLRVATGELADAVDMDKELGKQKQFLPVAMKELDSFKVKLQEIAKTDAKAAELLDIFEGKSVAVYVAPKDEIPIEEVPIEEVVDAKV